MVPDKAGIKQGGFAETLKRENKKVLDQFSNEYPISDIICRNSADEGYLEIWFVPAEIICDHCAFS